LVLGLVVFAAVGAGFYLVLINIATRSADPVIQTQGIYLARAYLDEAVLRDPSGPAEACGSNRASWQNMATYADCVDESLPTDPLGNAITDLGDYRVSISLGTVSLAPGTSQRRVEVNVTHTSASLNFSLAGYRGLY
jgi:MSHA pilin protein MshD